MLAGLERDVARQDDHSNSAPRDRGSHRSFQRPRHLCRSRYQLTVVTASLEQKLWMRLLEIIGAYLGAWNVGRNCENGHGASMAVKESVDEMKVAGTATPRADRELAGDVRIGARGKGRYFLVADVNPFDGFLSAYRLGDPIERIANYSIDSLNPCCRQSPYQVFGYCGHKISSSYPRSCPPVFGNEYLNWKRMVDHIGAVVLVMLVRLNASFGIFGTGQQCILSRIPWRDPIKF